MIWLNCRSVVGVTIGAKHCESASMLSMGFRESLNCSFVNNNATTKTRLAHIRLTAILAKVLFEGKLKISDDHTGGYAAVELFIQANNIAGHNWWTQCVLGTSGGAQASFYCDVTTDPRGVYEVEYSTGTSASLDTWHVLRIETDPSTAELGFFLDGKLVGNYVPTDAADLVTANTFRPKVTVWNGDVNTRRHPFRRRRADHTGAVRVWIAKARRCTKHAKREEHEVAGRSS